MTIGEISNAIANDVSVRTLTFGLNKITINVNEINIEYRAFVLPSGTINNGTYFILGK